MRVRVTYGFGGGGSQNQPPVITSIPNQSNTEGDVVSLQVNATDPENGVLTYSASSLPTGLSINSSTGLISGTISVGAETSSPYITTITVTDDGSPIGSSQILVTWNVSAPAVNQPPIVTTIPTQTNDESDVVSLQVSATDPDGNNLSYSATGLPSGLSINSATGLISGTISAGAATSSPYTTTVTVTDDGSPIESTDEVFTWNVSVVVTNQPPIITTIPTQTNSESDVVSLQVNATDPDGDNLSYSATGLPAGLSINSSTGLISGTISAGAEASSPYITTITVTDDGSPTESSDEVFTWNVSAVNQPPVVTTIPTQTNDESDVVSLQVSATDPDGDNLSYSAVGLPAGISINTSTGLISGTISVGAEASSPYTTTVTVTDDGSPIESTNEVFTWNVSAVATLTDTILYDVGDVVVDTINGSLSGQYVYNNYPSNNIVRIEIGTSCTSIGDYWMSGSTDLNTELTFPDSVTSIGSYAFGNCFAIPNTVLELPDSAVTVSSSAFAYLPVTDVVAVNTATNLSDYSFFASTASTAYLAPSFSNVSSLAFYYCSNFSTVYAKDAVANGWTLGAGQSILGASSVTVFNWDNYPNPIPN